MPQHVVNWQFNAILLVVTTTILPHTLTLGNKNTLKAQEYDYVDVAKETANSRSKGQTTRIFTEENDLDEEFWLKYLGEDFRQAVHLEIDDNNNIIPLEDKKPQRPQMKYITRGDKRTRFVRHPSENNKHLTNEDSLNEENNKQFSTEKPKTFNVTLKATNISLHDTQQGHSMNNFSHNKKSLKHKNKLLIHNKYKQKIFRPNSSNSRKAYLPKIHNFEQRISGENSPEFLKIPSVIYHQKLNLHQRKFSNPQLFVRNNFYTDEIPHLSLGNQNIAELYQEHQNHNSMEQEVPNLTLNNQHNELYSDRIQNTPMSHKHQHQHHTLYEYPDLSDQIHNIPMNSDDHDDITDEFSNLSLNNHHEKSYTAPNSHSISHNNKVQQHKHIPTFHQTEHTRHSPIEPPHPYQTRSPSPMSFVAEHSE